MRIRSLTDRLNRNLQLAASTVLLPLLSPAVMAVEDVRKDLKLAGGGDDSGATMSLTTGEQLNSITELIWGPGMYLLMAIGAVVAVYGFLKGSKEALWTGVGTFIFAALLRTLVPIFTG
ncbi:MAG: hypothetical protein ACOCXA_05090 [Planctomycetota bacterium]